MSPISCVLTNVQRGTARFEDTEYEERPNFKAWRCELTALSRVYNLYFVAYGELIFVYQPRFPDQSLPDKPAIILRPPITSPNLGYTLDAEEPHSVNRLHVDFLGREEIVLVVCDDGDVVGYNVSHIQRAVDQRAAIAREDDDFDDLEVNLRVFLHRNVGKSAWGLAVHRQARLIAISSNTHKVVVVAYALANPPNTDIDPDCSDSSSTSSPVLDEFSDDDFPSPRKRDHIITLQAEANVPSVSFDNNGTDPNGRWLFSSSIDGKTMLWDLHGPRKPAKIIQLGRCVNSEGPADTGCGCFDRAHIPHAAWHAMFLDPRSCRKVHNYQDAFGGEPIERAPGFWDMTSSKPHRDDLGPIPVFHIPYDTETEDEEQGEEIVASGADNSGETSEHDDEESGDQEGEAMAIHYEEDESESDTNTDTDDEDETHLDDGHTTSSAGAAAPTEGQAGGPPDLQSLFIPEDPPNALTAEHIFNDIMETHSQQIEEPATIVFEGIETFEAPLPPIPPEPDTDSDDDEENPAFAQLANIQSAQLLQLLGDTATPMTFGVTPSVTNVNGNIQIHFSRPTRQPNKKPYLIIQNGSSDDGKTPQPANIASIPPALIVTKQDIYLLQPAHILSSPQPSSKHPIILIQYPQFPLPNGETFAPHWDRLCYSTQVPELGIALVATPAGKVVILSLTQMNAASKDGNGKGVVYGMKIDHVLPSREIEEKHHSLLHSRLVGIAVGPVQGMLDSPADDFEAGGMDVFSTSQKPRRWRLMIAFHDHSVLSYELGKYGDDEGVSVSELMV